MKIYGFVISLLVALIAQPLAFLSILGRGVAAVTRVAAFNMLKASPFGAPPLALGANTLTNLIPDAYAALKVVSRELVGLIPSVNRDSTVDRLALNQNIRSGEAPINTAGADIVPAMSLPPAADQVFGNTAFTIQKSRKYPFSWTGEEIYAVDQGPGSLTLNQQQIAQAFRAAASEIAVHGMGILRVGASRAFGTAGTTPFATNLGESAQLRKVLDDNGTPATDRSLVINTASGANLRTLLNNPLNSNTSLNGDLTSQGVILDLNGFKFREEAQIPTVVKGTGAAYTSTAAGFAVGTKVIPLITGTGTVLAGDVVTFAGDLNKYVVAVGVAAPGSITLASPGLMQAIPAAATAMTIGNNYACNIGFSRDFATLGTRLPIVPKQGDLATFRETITDPVSGISFELAYYPGYGMGVFELRVCWGWAVFNPEHGAILLG